MTAVRKKHRIVVLDCLWFQRQRDSRRASRRRHSSQGLALRTKQDYSFAVPRAT